MNIDKYLKIGRIGASGIHDHSLFRAIILLNWSAIIAIATTFVYSVMTLFMGKTSFLSLSLMPMLFYPTILLLNYFKRFYISRIAFVLFSNFFIVLSCYIMGGQFGFQYFFVTLVMLTLLFFSSKEIKLTVTFSLLSIFLSAFITLFPSLFKGLIQVESQAILIIQAFFSIASGLVVLFAGLALVQTIEKFQLIALKEEAEHIEKSKLKALSTLSAGVAHEINNPLSIIKMKSEQLIYRLENHKIDSVKLIEGLEKIKKHSIRISEIIVRLRSLSHERDKDPPSYHSVNELIKNGIQLCLGRINSIGIKINYDLSEDFQIYCRPFQIVELVTILLNNAIDSVSLCQEKWIKIELKKKGSTCHIKIIDSGLGVEKGLEDKIMLPFFTTKGVGEGTGLGLSVASTIVSKHKGKLYLDKQSQHTCFTVSFPAGEKKAA